jgi:hypothetical protein
MIRIPFRSIMGMLLLAALCALPAQHLAAQTAPAATPDAPAAAAPDPAQTAPAPAQDAPMQISWEVRNRFRLFREERDFLLHVENERGRSILASEQALEPQGDGRGWARNMVNRLCIDLQGRVNEPCTRDNVKESYLTPTDHPVTLRLTGEVPVGATCAWTIDDGQGPPRQTTLDCAEPLNFRAPYGHPSSASVDVSSGPDTPQHLTTQIEVRDYFIAGLGDSVASGEGNPDRAIALADEGFCFRSYLGTASAQYYRPSRAGYKGGRACEAPDTLQNWQRQSALWFNSACHRSLYSYQTRTALDLAVQYPHIAVTYLPLACTGATIANGLLGSQQARECLPKKSANTCQGSVNSQLSELREALAAAKRRQPDRNLDLVLLSIGANDINFSGLVADVIVDTPTERVLFRRTGVIGSVDDSRAALARDLPQGFGKLRDALKPLVGDMSHVVFVSYANPALAGGAPCPGGRAGFDIHPSFNLRPERIANVSNYVQNEFLPQLKALALCQSGILCRDPSADRMTFVDAHQAAFADHGFCARAESDPDFDRACFSATGQSFNPDIVTAANQPMLCDRSPGDYRAYLPRARWIRDANDSYFAAMTYPQALPTSSQPSDIHDATWGILSAVYGGAVHPSAEGHAVMADATVPAAANVLGLNAAEPEPVPVPAAPAAVVPPTR